MPEDEEHLHWFRRLLLVVLGSGLLAGGLAYAVFVLLPGRFFSGWLTLGAGFMVAIGGYILWEDIARPAARYLRRRIFTQPTSQPSTSEAPPNESTHRGGGRVR